jgi:hypothetical protein
MKRIPLLFTSSEELATRISGYFKWIEGELHQEEPSAKTPAKVLATDKAITKVWDREPQPPTLSGLALYLGFTSRQTFEEYEINGKHAPLLKRARLRIESEYEKKLHYQSSTGAIFALKSLGWTDKTENKTDSAPLDNFTLKVEIIETGPMPAHSEREVQL